MTINSETDSTINPHHTLDTTGLVCPEPVMMLHKIIRKAALGDIIEIIATDPATTRDIPNFCHHLGHELLSTETLLTKDDTGAEDRGKVTRYRYMMQKNS